MPPKQALSQLRVRSWGLDENGQLGVARPLFNLQPFNTINLSGVTAVACGGFHCFCLKSDGTVWAWGYNADGELGDGTATDRSTPVNVLTMTGVVMGVMFVVVRHGGELPDDAI